MRLRSRDYTVIVEFFLKKTCCNEKFVAFFFTEHLDNDDHYNLQQSQPTDFAHHIGAVMPKFFHG